MRLGSTVIDESFSTVAAPAMAPAIISPCTCRLRTLASISPARSWLNWRMLSTSATRPKMLRKTMRRVRLEKVRVAKNCQEWRAAPRMPSVRSTRHDARKNSPVRPAPRIIAAGASRRHRRNRRRRLSQRRTRRTVSPGRTVSTAELRAWAVRSSTRIVPVSFASLRPAMSARPPGKAGCARSGELHFLEAIADAVERLNHIEVVVALLEFFAQALDVTVDRASVDINLVVVSGGHEGVAALDDPGPGGERLQDQEFRDRQGHRLGLPGAGMAFGI